MTHHVTPSAGGGSQSHHEMGPFPDSTPEGLRTESDEDTLGLLTIMSHNIRSSLLSMMATLKLLNRGYYGKMDEEVAQKIKELLFNATHLSGIAEECLGRTFVVLEGLKMHVRSKEFTENCEPKAMNKY